MFLSDTDIRRQIRIGNLVVTPVLEWQFQPGSIDLRLGQQFRTWGHGDPTPIDPYEPPAMVGWEGPITVYPGDLVLGTTIERVRLPNFLTGFVQGKSSLARLGIQVECAGMVDPGFEGEITLELTVIGRRAIHLYPLMPIAQIMFARLETPASRAYGDPALGSHYQGQRGPVESRYGK